MITFRGSGSLESSDIVTSGYVQDHWRLNDRLALDLGQRFDRDEMIGESHFSPRAASRWRSIPMHCDGFIARTPPFNSGLMLPNSGPRLLVPRPSLRATRTGALRSGPVGRPCALGRSRKTHR